MKSRSGIRHSTPIPRVTTCPMTTHIPMGGGCPRITGTTCTAMFPTISATPTKKMVPAHHGHDLHRDVPHDQRHAHEEDGALLILGQLPVGVPKRPRLCFRHVVPTSDFRALAFLIQPLFQLLHPLEDGHEPFIHGPGPAPALPQQDAHGQHRGDVHAQEQEERLAVQWSPLSFQSSSSSWLLLSLSPLSPMT